MMGRPHAPSCPTLARPPQTACRAVRYAVRSTRRRRAGELGGRAGGASWARAVAARTGCPQPREARFGRTQHQQASRPAEGARPLPTCMLQRPTSPNGRRGFICGWCDRRVIFRQLISFPTRLARVSACPRRPSPAPNISLARRRVPVGVEPQELQSGASRIDSSVEADGQAALAPFLTVSHPPRRVGCGVEGPTSRTPPTVLLALAAPARPPQLLGMLGMTAGHFSTLVLRRSTSPRWAPSLGWLPRRPHFSTSVSRIRRHAWPLSPSGERGARRGALVCMGVFRDDLRS